VGMAAGVILRLQRYWVTAPELSSTALASVISSSSGVFYADTRTRESEPAARMMPLFPGSAVRDLTAHAFEWVGFAIDPHMQNMWVNRRTAENSEKCGANVVRRPLRRATGHRFRPLPRP
jgi:hypothetical protein